MRLKHLLIVCFLTLSVLPLLFGFGILHSYTASQYRLQIGDKLSAISQLAKLRLTGAIDRINDNVSLLSSHYLLRQQMRAFDETRDYVLYDKIGQSLIDAHLGMDSILDMTVFATNGQFIASINRRATSFDPELLVGRERTTTLLHSQDLIVRSMSRMYAGDKFVGYMIIDFSADFILQLVNDRTGLGETGEWLFAVRGQEGEAVFAVPLKYDANAAFSRRVSKDRGDVPITQSLLGNEILMSNAPDYLGVPVMASTRYLPSMDWGLVAKINEAEVSQIIEASNRYFIVLGLGVMVFAIAAAFWISGVIARPVEKLRQSTRRVIEGDFDYQQFDASWREARELGNSFGEMSASLSDFRENLQDMVDERTCELDEANRRLLEISIRDPLTGVHNRRYLTERLDEEFSRTRRYNGELAVVMFDIDHFKRINDTFGHGAGDEVLIGLAFSVQHTLRTSDLFGRVGGEEFCIVIPEAEVIGTTNLVERLRTKIQELPFVFDGKELNVTCSFGICFISEPILTSMSLMECADKALYHAKQTGRNKVVVYNDMDTKKQPDDRSLGETGDESAKV
ncbi:sensor domain-containing diguanylate cyclase [Thalassospira australica]|uniref:sensor domain-containing diguanylate cyclase n=1 Tax=Thalassospira australica TaxID=1528106 RepID=UPI00068C6BC9|nr:sensor domain-containing diguanylate cyclase [Thalassospira australica]